MSDRGSGRTGWIAVVLVGVVMVAGLGWSYQKQQQATNKVTAQQEEQVVFDTNLYEFLRRQCLRDDFRDSVIIRALEDAKRRAVSSIQDPIRRKFEVAQIQGTIDLLEGQAGQCLRTIPEVKS